MKVGVIIQARMGSTRLPGKIMKEVMGKPLLEYQIERVKRAKTIDEIIIATTTKKADNQIAEFCEQLSIPCYRGSEEDVLARYYEAATKYKVDIIVRITSDCPVIDPEVIDRVVDKYQDGNYDYVSNTIERTFPRGMDTEVFSYATLKQMYNEANQSIEREHVTPYLYLNPDRFKIGNYSNEDNHGFLRLTVDTQEDFLLIEDIFINLYSKNPKFKLKDLVYYLVELHPEKQNINCSIEQKKLGE